MTVTNELLAIRIVATSPAAFHDALWGSATHRGPGEHEVSPYACRAPGARQLAPRISIARRGLGAMRKEAIRAPTAKAAPTKKACEKAAPVLMPP